MEGQKNEQQNMPNSLSVEEFIRLHEAQLKSNDVPRICWESLHAKIMNEVYDAGLHFSIMRVEYEDAEEMGWRVVVSNPEGVHKDQNDSIFLVDHAWTYDNMMSRESLSSVNGLLERMCLLMDVDMDKSDEDKIDIVLEKMWQYNQTYSFAGFEKGSTEASPLWYVLDEFGSRVQHSDDPNIKMVPFFCPATKTAYSIFWPTRDLEVNEEVTRDYVPYIPLTEELSRLSHLLPWNPCDFTDLDEEVEEPGAGYFKLSRFDDADLVNPRTVTLPTDRQILVWTSDPVVDQYLTHNRFKLTENREEADIIWQLESIKDFRELSNRDVLVNQFPYESLLTTKDLLAIVSRRAAMTGNTHPRWMPTTYNLNADLAEFICHFQKREQKGEDNHWIAKPWNLGRGIGHVVTKNINCLVRLPESGPYIAMKYIESPVLYKRPDGVGDVKFDYRYVVNLISIKPLKLSCYRKFFLRFANREFSLDSLDVYDKHFTVHNYSDPDKLLNMNCEDFIPAWNSQYPEHPWADVETDTMQSIRELFEAASSKAPPFGMPNYPQARAHYAIDVMLKWDTNSEGDKVMVPQILECNFSPDSKRGCRNYNDYFNSVFRTLFLEDHRDTRIEDDQIMIAS